MSFILDALRKSEQERQRNERPGIADIQTTAPSPGRSIWIPLVTVLVVINVGLLTFLWINAAPKQQPAVALPPRPTMAAPVPPANLTMANRRLSDEIAVPAPRQTVAPAAVRQPTKQPPKAQSAARISYATDEYSNLPTLVELTMAGSIQLKPLHLELHVYSEQPTERFVFINKNKYREGDKLQDGPVVNTITNKGVVLNYQGRDFLLNRE